jgi:hypothetical protein
VLIARTAADAAACHVQTEFQGASEAFPACSPPASAAAASFVTAGTHAYSLRSRRSTQAPELLADTATTAERCGRGRAGRATSTAR